MNKDEIKIKLLEDLEWHTNQLGKVQFQGIAWLIHNALQDYIQRLLEEI